MRSTKHQAGSGSLSSSPALISSPPSASPSVPSPLIVSWPQGRGRNDRVSKQRPPKKNEDRVSGGGSRRNNDNDVSAATAASRPLERRSNGRYARRGPRNPEHNDRVRGETAAVTASPPPSTANVKEEEPAADDVVCNEVLVTTSEDPQEEANDTAPKARSNHNRNNKKKRGNVKHNVPSALPIGSTPQHGSVAGEQDVRRAMSSQNEKKGYTAGEEVLEVRDQTPVRLRHNNKLQQQEDSRRRRCPATQKSKDKKDAVTATAAKRLREKEGTSTTATKPSMSPPPHQQYPQQQSSTEMSPGQPEPLVRNSVEDDNNVLPRALRDPAIVEHHVRTLSGPDESESLHTGTATSVHGVAELPPDPCVVKVVSSTTCVAHGGGGGREKREGEGERDGAQATPQTDTTTTTTAAAILPFPSQLSEEDIQLSRRGLRVEAAPWSPAGRLASFGVEVVTTSLASAFSRATLISPPSSVNQSSMMKVPSTTPTTASGNAATAGVFRPVEGLSFFAAPAPSIGVSSVSVPAVTITSTLMKDVGSAVLHRGSVGVAQMQMLEKGNTPVLPARSGATRDHAVPATAAAGTATIINPAVTFSTQQTRMASPASLLVHRSATTSVNTEGGLDGVDERSTAVVGSPLTFLDSRSRSPLDAITATAAASAGHSGLTHTHKNYGSAARASSSGTTTATAVAIWGSHFSPSSVMREDDAESSAGTPLLTSPAFDPTASATSTTNTAAVTAASATGLERPATAPAIRRTALTVTNTATGARMSSTLTTPSCLPMGLWTVGGGGGGGAVNTTTTTTTVATGGSATTALTPSWANSSSGSCEFPATPFPTVTTTSTTVLHHHHSPLQQQLKRGCHSLSSLGNGGSNYNLAELNNSGNNVTEAAMGALTPTGWGSTLYSGGSSCLGSPQLSLQYSSTLLSNLQFPRNGSTNSPASRGGGAGTGAGATTSARGNASSSLLFRPPQSNFSPPMQVESDLDCVLHNRVAVSDVAARNETTLVDTLFADAEVDVIEDDESEMDNEDGMGISSDVAALRDWWPAYPTDSSPHASAHSPDSHAHGYGSASSPTVARAGTNFGGGYWYKPGSSGGGSSTTTAPITGQPRQHFSGGGSGSGHGAGRSRFSPGHRVRRAVSVSCASVASSTMSLLDPKQPAADLGPAAYDNGEDEEWEMNSSAYADSLDEAQIQWIEEQLKATENPVGYF